MNRPNLIFRALAWLLVFAWAAGIYYLSGLSGKEIEEAMPVQLWDKLLHFLAFCTGAVLLAAALRLTRGWSWRLLIPITAIVISLYGASDEWHQTFTKGRNGGDPGDWLADTLGGIVGATGCAWAAEQLARRRSTP